MKTKQTHTPGPLTYFKLKNDNPDEKADMWQVVRYGFGYALAYSEADARRICSDGNAAPDLLAALKALHKRMITESDNLPDDNEFLKIENDSMAAIAKAEGV